MSQQTAALLKDAILASFREDLHQTIKNLGTYDSITEIQARRDEIEKLLAITEVVPGEGIYFAYPMTLLEQSALIYRGDFCLIQVEDTIVFQSEKWSDSVDGLTGLKIKIRRADCGLGCKCAAEVRVVIG